MSLNPVKPTNVLILPRQDAYTSLISESRHFNWVRDTIIEMRNTEVVLLVIHSWNK